MPLQTETLVNIIALFGGMFFGYLFGRYVGIRDTVQEYRRKQRRKSESHQKKEEDSSA